MFQITTVVYFKEELKQKSQEKCIWTKIKKNDWLWMQDPNLYQKSAKEIFG